MSIRQYKVLVPQARAEAVRTAIEKLSIGRPVHLDAIGSLPPKTSRLHRRLTILELSCREDYTPSMMDTVTEAAGPRGWLQDVEILPLNEPI